MQEVTDVLRKLFKCFTDGGMNIEFHRVTALFKKYQNIIPAYYSFHDKAIS